MNLYIYSDESGVFDKEHYKYYVFGGIIAIDNNENIKYNNKYKNIEKLIRGNTNIPNNTELKASFLKNKTKEHIFRSLNDYNKFATIIDLNSVLPQIYLYKKSKQRYLDYAYKITIKNAIIELFNKKSLNLNDIDYIYFYIDQHTTATDGYYELRESMLNEFKYGTYNINFNKYFEPICSKLKDLQVNYCDSRDKILIRTSDIIANRIYYLINNNKDAIKKIDNINITYLPK